MSPKFVKVLLDGSVEWESGENRTVEVPHQSVLMRSIPSWILLVLISERPMQGNEGYELRVRVAGPGVRFKRGGALLVGIRST